MPCYEIEQYEIWTQKYRVVAENPIAAERSRPYRARTRAPGEIESSG